MFTPKKIIFRKKFCYIVQRLTYIKNGAKSAIYILLGNYSAVPTLTPTVGRTFIELQPTKLKLKQMISKTLFMN